MDGELTVLMSTSPHFHKGDSTARIMWSVTACLVPAAVWGVVAFGARSLLILLLSIAASTLTEFVIARALKRGSVLDGSAVLTGMLIGFNMPAAVPVFVPVLASVFAIAVVKWAFGGLGTNWMNPALAGRVFAMFSWTGGMTRWTAPRAWGVDAVTSASPLGALKSGLVDAADSVSGPMDFLRGAGYQVSSTDSAVTAWIGRTFGEVPEGYVDAFLGNIPGCIGEVSALLLIVGAIYLFARRIVTWHIPVAYLGSFAALVWLLGGARYGLGAFQGNVVFHLFTGGLMLGALYMATDMVTSPLTGRGMIVFGVGCGALTFLIRFYGSFPEGVSLAILLMNMFVPLINRATKPRKFGYVKEQAE